ncbi:WG repeat-containing protein [Propionivibrio sp.]|uniref:WG repeat-containing protein n=1 Tax=Propionivibrio sp. TaxID=2212460 RepID=UPI003BF0A048
MIFLYQLMRQARVGALIKLFYCGVTAVANAKVTVDLMPIEVAENRQGYIDGQGGMVVAPQFEVAAHFTEDSGLAGVYQNGKWGFINMQGRLVVKPKFDFANSSSNGRAAFMNKDKGKWGYIDILGGVVIAPQFDWAKDFSPAGLAEVQQGKKWGYIDKQGLMVIPPKFDFTEKFSNDGFAPVLSNGLWGLIDSQGNVVLDYQYFYLSAENQGLFAVRSRNNGKWGFIDRKGTMVIPEKFDNLSGFVDGLIGVQVGDKWGVMNAKGVMIVAPRFDGLVFLENGLVAYRQNDKWGLMNRPGEVLVAPKFDHVQGYDTGDFVRFRLNGKDGYTDAKGKIIAVASTSECGAPVLRDGTGKVTWPSDLGAACKAARIQNAARQRKEENHLQSDSAKIDNFRRGLKVESETNCGPVLDTKGNLIKIYYPVQGYGNEHWIKRGQLLPPGSGCRFVNGNYDPSF